MGSKLILEKEEKSMPIKRKKGGSKDICGIQTMSGILNISKNSLI